VTQTNGKTRLVLPGPRILDSVVFGTPQRPGVYDPLLGDVTKFGLTYNGGYTITKGATPFSNWPHPGTGSVRMSVVDATAIDAATTKDQIDFEANFRLPDGVAYRVVVKRPLSHGSDHPVFGGVATNVLMHGATGIGTALMPTEFAYVTFWGLGDIYRNGKLVNKNHLVHAMVTEHVRDANFTMRSENRVGRNASGRVMHLMIPPFKPVPGKSVVPSPLKTKFMPFPLVKKQMMKTLKKVKGMPDGPKKMRMLTVLKQSKKVMAKTKAHVVDFTKKGKMFGMPFIHIMFEDLKIQASR
jgi:hypothetical protein